MTGPATRQTTEQGHLTVTCGAEEESDERDDAHVAHWGVECESDDREGDPSVLNGCLQRYRYYLNLTLPADHFECLFLLVFSLV